ncbi:MAG: hypothetical protein EOM91_12135 [Sphingobacteriia bacterium]|jgi:hypothetical protein|nr:hypothetical protein [Sphingobacteriia bacterium]
MDLILWFYSGTRVFQGESDTSLFPDSNAEAERVHWLAGFVVAWLSRSWFEPASQVGNLAFRDESLEDSLQRALAEHPDLLRLYLKHPFVNGRVLH